MNKAELVEVLAERLGGSRKEATAALEAVVEEIQRAVSKGDKVSITGFGVFEKRDRKARTARNPRTGESVKVKKTSVPAFRPGQGFKDIVVGAKKLAKSASKSTASRPAAKATNTATKAATKKVAAPAKKVAATKAVGKKVAKKASGRK